MCYYATSGVAFVLLEKISICYLPHSPVRRENHIVALPDNQHSLRVTDCEAQGAEAALDVLEDVIDRVARLPGNLALRMLHIMA